MDGLMYGCMDERTPCEEAPQFEGGEIEHLDGEDLALFGT